VYRNIAQAGNGHELGRIGPDDTTWQLAPTHLWLSSIVVRVLDSVIARLQVLPLPYCRAATLGEQFMHMCPAPLKLRP